MTDKILIGRTDKADFPDLMLKNLDVKIDTGAFTSAIHCHQIEEVVLKRKKVIKFKLLDPTHPKYNNKQYATSRFSQKIIKSSFGRSEKRYVIHTRIRIFGKTFPIDLSLSERGEMKYPVLLGRKLLMGKFIVDPAKYNLSYKQKRSRRTAIKNRI